MVNTFITLILTTMLLLCGIQDLRKKKIYLWIIILGAVLLIICIPFSDTFSIPDRIGGILIGVTVIIISLATAGKIGMGDALLLCVTGLANGFWSNLELFAVALLLASITSIVLLILRLVDRKKSIPFVPFLFVSYVFLIFAG